MKKLINNKKVANAVLPRQAREISRQQNWMSAVMCQSIVHALRREKGQHDSRGLSIQKDGRTRTAVAYSLVAFLFGSGALLATPAQAITLLTIGGGGFLEDDAVPLDPFGQQYTQQSAAAPVQDGLFGLLQTQNATTAGTVSARSRATFGQLSAETSLILFAPVAEFGNRHNGVGQAEAAFYDDITITPTDPSLSSQLGFVRGVLYLTGGLSVDADNAPILSPNFARSSMSSAWNVQMNLGDGVISDVAVWSANGQVNGELPPVYTGTMIPAALNFELSYWLGSTAQLSVNMFLQSVGTALAGRGDVSGSVLLYNTLGWGGITSVTTADGTPISYQLTSGSGVDWTQSAVTPVPVPAAVWLFGSGLLGLIGIARRKK